MRKLTVCVVKKLMYMRSHLSKHILLGESKAEVCGLCLVLHSSNLRKIATRNSYYKYMSECQYFYEFSYKSVFKMTISNSSRNRPKDCKECGSCVWKCNLITHYEEKH